MIPTNKHTTPVKITVLTLVLFTIFSLKILTEIFLYSISIPVLYYCIKTKIILRHRLLHSINNILPDHPVSMKFLYWRLKKLTNQYICSNAKELSIVQRSSFHFSSQ